LIEGFWVIQEKSWKHEKIPQSFFPEKSWISVRPFFVFPRLFLDNQEVLYHLSRKNPAAA
jgi:hypothetical protein